MVVFRQGEFVWLDSSTGVPIGAQVKLSDTGQQQYVDDEGKIHKVSKKNEATLRPMHPTSVEGVDDMIRLGDLNEAGLLRNLLVRYRQGVIYTYTGSILVAVNPYQLLPIYTMEYVQLYHNRRLGELPPHIFAIADSCYYNMQRHQRDQCCIISGESGAGKTESTKLLLQFLAAVSGQHSWIEQQVLEANPILEGFGNAKTVRNDNSSRFGKYIDIKFGRTGAIEGARVEQYLLEKCRVCRQAPEERNYHVFYCMLLGLSAEQKKILSLGNAAEYNYLTAGNCTSCDGRDDSAEYNRIRSAMKILMFKEQESWDVFKLLAALLHLGNVTFRGTTSNNMESSDIQTSLHFTMASKLLEVDTKALEISLTHRTFRTNRECVSRALSPEQAIDGRDAFAKATYGKMFVWIVEKINSVIYKIPTNNDPHGHRSIGLLDIFGFENFDKNSFEQLCINFANEQLQQFFVKHVFKQEQEEYTREKISWKHIAFNDNQLTLDLLANKPLNVLALIDEESHFPKGTDTTMLNKMVQVHGKNHLFVPPKNNHDMQFGIQHFAGAVFYDAEDFLEKNRDTLSLDLIKLMQTTSSNLLKEIFHTELAGFAKTARPNSKIQITPKSSLREVTDTRRQVTTLSVQFRQSLDSLMKTLSICQPYFIRCFKPNNYKKPTVFDRKLCMRQLQYSGMLETIRIRKMGYPIRHTFQEFLERYRVLLRTSICNPKTVPVSECCDCICKAYIGDDGDWKIGKRKIFLKDFHDTLLEVERDKEIQKKAVLIQRALQVYKYRKQFVNQRRAALVLQRHWRGFCGRKLYKVVQLGFARLQAKVRSRQLQQQYSKQRTAAIVLQSQVRRFICRRELKRKKKAVLILQAQTRGLLARRVAKRIRDSAFLTAQERLAQEQTALELQRRLEEVLRQQQEDKSEAVNDESVVENIFGFLPDTVNELEGSAPEDLEDLERMSNISKEEELQEDQKVEETPEEECNTISEDDPEHSFAKFASLYFQGSATHTHINHRLRNPLLYHEDERDALACLTIWWIILRFMGDIPEPKQARDNNSSVADRSIRQNLHQGRRLSNLVGLDQKLLRGKKKGEARNRRPSTIPEESSSQSAAENVKEEDDLLVGEEKLHRPLTSLEKLHIIMEYAIVREDIRDEIYCQICKQLVGNDDQRSSHRGWVLLSICLGIFPPTERFVEYLEHFIRTGPDGVAKHCSKRLRRTISNGVRCEPPCWMELQAAENKKPMTVSVTLMNGQNISLPVDSASNSEEICQLIAQKVHLQDTFGFSLYISLNEKMWSLGSSRKHVLDAISLCEQEVKRTGGEEQHAPWRLSFRKELFTPWHNCSRDPVSTDLIYRQIISGLKEGDYKSDKEDDFVQLSAKHFYVQFGTNCCDDNTRKVVQECISNTLIEAKSEAKWVQLVKTAHLQSPYIKLGKTPETVKAEVVDYALQKWPIFFSKFFEVVKLSGPDLPKNKFVAVINLAGITFLHENETLLEVTYAEVVDVNTISTSFAASVSLTTLKGDFLLGTSSAKEMGELVLMFLEGLKERSHYALALHDSNKQDDTTFLSFRKGDLLYVIRDEEYSPDRGWLKGKNERTGLTGAVSMDAVLVLATLSKPTTEILNLLSLSPEQRKSLVQVSNRDEGNTERVAPLSLKEFSFEYFRQPGKDGGRQGLGKGGGKEKLWACSREPLRQPLLKKLVQNSELSQLACLSFTAILKYMGDYPIKQVRSALELTDQIFGPAMQHEDLRDEIYCQIMRQMTSNHNRLSMENGWQLLWLCCGLFPPSQALLRHTQRFIESRLREPLASECLKRLKGTLRMEPRKRPPHQVEVDAIQQNSTQIFHKVHFPNDTDEIFEVTTTTHIRDLCYSITASLMLMSPDGFSLFVKTQDKMSSLNDSEYFFDGLRQVTDNPKKLKKTKDGMPVSSPYLVIFMRKLWFNVVPGRDLKADLLFHYPQELPKYLRGYHKCTKEEMIKLAGLLFRVKVDSDRSQFVMIPRMLRELVPADQLKTMSAEEWKKNIISSYNKHAGMTVDEAKVAILKAISCWHTFGCAFFEVKQTSEPTFPSIVMIAISKHGVTFINPKTKDVLAMHPFNRITNWSSGNTYFHMTVGNLVSSSTVLCETSLGYKMDDLLNSYFKMYLEERTAVRPRNQFFPA